MRAHGGYESRDQYNESYGEYAGKKQLETVEKKVCLSLHPLLTIVLNYVKTYIIHSNCVDCMHKD